jgi:hypothetical protein
MGRVESREGFGNNLSDEPGEHENGKL